MQNELNQRFAHFRACCDAAPDGTYELAKDIRGIIGRHFDALAKEIQERCPDIELSNCDGAHNVEATIYDWIRRAPNAPGQLFTAEGFGQAMSGPARARVLYQAERDRDALKALGVTR